MSRKRKFHLMRRRRKDERQRPVAYRPDVITGAARCVWLAVSLMDGQCRASAAIIWPQPFTA